MEKNVQWGFVKMQLSGEERKVLHLGRKNHRTTFEKSSLGEFIFNSEQKNNCCC